MVSAWPESEVDLIAWAKKVHAAYPVAFDASESDARRYQIHGIPAIVLIDSSGRVASIGVGEIAFAALARQIDATLVSERLDP